MTRLSRSPDKKKLVKSIKKTALNIKQKTAMKKKKTALNIKQETAMKKSNRRKSSSSTKKIASAIQYVQNEIPYQDDVAAEVDTVSWIIISNVHAKAAFENIITVLFQNFGELRSHAFQCDSGGNFQGVIDVAFERREDAEEAVDSYHNNIKLFGKTWRLHLIGKRRRTRSSSDAASSSSPKPVFCPLTSIRAPSRAAKSSPSTLSDVVRTLSLQESAVEIGVSAEVHISNISPNVPSEIIQGMQKVLSTEGLSLTFGLK